MALRNYKGIKIDLTWPLAEIERQINLQLEELNNVPKAPKAPPKRRVWKKPAKKRSRTKLQLMKARWRTMLDRCYSPESRGFRSYGAKGIQVCPRWHDFENFLEDLGLPPGEDFHLHRLDSKKDYSPENVVWVSAEAHTELHRKRS